MEQVADGRLVLFEKIHKLQLGVSAPIDFAQDHVEQVGFDFQGRSFGAGEAEVVKDVPFGDMGGPAAFGVAEGTASPRNPRQGKARVGVFRYFCASF